MKKKRCLIVYMTTLFLLLFAFTFLQKVVATSDLHVNGGDNSVYFIGTQLAAVDCRISGSSAICSGMVSLYQGYSCHLTLICEKQNSSGFWSEVDRWTGNGLTIERTHFNLTYGETYRAKLIAKVYQDSNFIETVTVISNSRNYQ